MTKHSAVTRLALAFIFSALAASAAEGPVKFVQSDKAAGLSKAVVVEKVPLVHTAQFLARPGGTLAMQVNGVFKQMAIALDAANSSLRNIVKLNVYTTSPQAVTEIQKLFAKKFKTPPAVTFVTGELPEKNVMVAMDAVATVSGVVAELKRVPEACILPPGGVVYISGQADKSELIEATGKTLEKLEETLKFLGLGKNDVVQCKAFVQPISRTGEVRAVFEKFFGKDCPPLVFVDWKSKEPSIEIELIAASKPGGPEQMEFLTQPGATPSPVYAKIVKVNSGKLVFISGLYGKTPGDATAEVNEIFAELGEILQGAGSDMTRLAKATYYVSNNETSGKLNELRPKYYDPKRPPAASKAMVPGVGVAGFGITLDMIAVTAPE